MRPDYSPRSYAPANPSGMGGLFDDLKALVYDPIKAAVTEADVLPSSTDVTSAVKEAATTRLQQSIQNLINPPKTASQPASTTATGAPVEKLGATDGSTAPVVAPWYTRLGEYAQEHPIQTTVAVVAVAWGVRELLKRRGR